MDCSLREATRKEQSIAPQNAFSRPIRMKKRAKIPYIRVLLVFQKRLDFLQAKEWFFRCFLRPCISGTFCRFVPCDLSCLMVLPATSINRAGNFLTLSDRYGLCEATWEPKFAFVHTCKCG